MILGVEQVVDGVVAKLKAEWTDACTEVAAVTGSPESDVPPMLPGAYFAGQKMKWELFPNFTVVPLNETPGDENSEYEWVRYPFEVWYLDQYEDEAILSRRVWRAARAFRNIFADDQSGRGPNLDGYATGVIRCGLLDLEYGPIFPGEGSVFLQGFKASLRADVEETR
jgi:hypothetical protein